MYTKTVNEIKSAYWARYITLSLITIFICIVIGICSDKVECDMLLCLWCVFFVGILYPVIFWLCYDKDLNNFYEYQKEKYINELKTKIDLLFNDKKEIEIQVLGKTDYNIYVAEDIVEQMCLIKLSKEYSDHSKVMYQKTLNDINIYLNELNEILNPPQPITFTSIGFSIPVG